MYVSYRIISYRIISCHIRVFHGFKLGDLFLHCYKFNLSNFFGTYYKRHKPISTPPPKKIVYRKHQEMMGFRQ